MKLIIDITLKFGKNRFVSHKMMKINILSCLCVCDVVPSFVRCFLYTCFVVFAWERCAVFHVVWMLLLPILTENGYWLVGNWLCLLGIRFNDDLWYGLTYNVVSCTMNVVILWHSLISELVLIAMFHISIIWDLPLHLSS